MNTEIAPRILEHRFSDGAVNQWRLFLPPGCSTVLVWMPALGVAARHYDHWARVWHDRGVGVALVECRGNGASSLRAGRRQDFGYREILQLEMPEMMAILRRTWPDKQWWLGGHSLGGQLACLYNALDGDFQRLVLVGTGAPWYRCYGSRGRLYRLLIHLARGLTRLLGYYPGRRLRFGGNEGKRCVMDWSHSALTGRFIIHGSDVDVEAAMKQARTPIVSVWFERDELISRAGWKYLMDKMPEAPRRTREMGSPPLQVPADHFAWMKAPEPVVDALLELDASLENEVEACM